MTKDLLYNRLMLGNHSLIAGASGAGKSVLENGCICYALNSYPNACDFIFIDLKRVELYAYRCLKQCCYYADDIQTALTALDMAVNEIEFRYKEMQRQGLKKTTRRIMYVIIDELADLMLSTKQAAPKIQRITQLGRAANVKLIACTQCPLVKVIPTQIKVNFDVICGLRTRSKQDSRNILGQAGCECLPTYGNCLLQLPEYNDPILFTVPNCTDADIRKAIDKAKIYF